MSRRIITALVRQIPFDASKPLAPFIAAGLRRIVAKQVRRVTGKQVKVTQQLTLTAKHNAECYKPRATPSADLYPGLQ